MSSTARSNRHSAHLELPGNALSLDSIDLAAVEETDPSIVDGYKVVYDRECPFEMRSTYETKDSVRSPNSQVDSTDHSTLEAIKVKVLVLGDEARPASVRVELISENDLFFHYSHTVDEVDFRMMQEQQKLMIDFPDYVNVLIKMLNSCIQEPNTHLAVFLITDKINARLDFIRNMEYKFVELLTCAFTRSPDELVKQHLAYRYNSLKNRMAVVQSQMAYLTALVKNKNPSLLLQLQQHVPQQ